MSTIKRRKKSIFEWILLIVMIVSLLGTPLMLLVSILTSRAAS